MSIFIFGKLKARWIVVLVEFKWYHVMSRYDNEEIVEIEEIETISNLAFSERLICVGTGAYMIFNGLGKLFKRPLSAVSEVAIGGALLYRGGTGYCAIKGYCEKDDVTFDQA